MGSKKSPADLLNGDSVSPDVYVPETHTQQPKLPAPTISSIILYRHRFCKGEFGGFFQFVYFYDIQNIQTGRIA